MTPPPAATLEALGFCGADDSVNPRHLALLGRTYPRVEWGVLFRPDKAGTPRYASAEWVSKLVRVLRERPAAGGGGAVRLAAHLCGAHVNDLLSSSVRPAAAGAIDAFLRQLWQWGFRRVQVNATAVNGVFTEKLGEGTTVQSLLRTARQHPELEFIVQKNDETTPLWSALTHAEAAITNNITFLHDESKGTGKETSGGWPAEARFVAAPRRAVGYAGGIKPANVRAVAEQALQACAASGGDACWIDMESGVRTTVLRPDGTTEDIFDLAKCFDCIDRLCDAGVMHHPHSGRP